VLGTIVLVGMFEVGKLAVNEATIAFQSQIEIHVADGVEPEAVAVSEAIAPAEISRQSGVRRLRQVATQRGIRNAGRMRKPELLALLQLA
jgi:Rho termination factor, N-terminal domain